MTRSSWLGVLLVLSLVLGLGLAVACAKSGDDDDSSSDDASDDTGGDCTLADICDYEVNTCQFSQWTDLNDCNTNAPIWLADNCGSNVAAAEACFCDCFTGASSCDNYTTCSTACVTEFCS